MVSRTKTLESVLEKAARKNVEHPLDILDDLVGVRVVCLLRSDILRIGQIVRGQFKVLSEDNKLDGVSVESFGYQSVHFIVKLRDSCAGPRYQGLHSILFEVQIRTLAMDAWAALSHYLDYKSESDVPKDLRKDFFALSGLFYVADTHFELFYAERQKSKATANKTVSMALVKGQNQELNLDTLSAFLRKRYPDRVHAGSAGVSELVGELSGSGYTTLDKLSDALDASMNAFQKYEKAHPPGGEGKHFRDVGVVRIALGIFDEAFAEKKYSNDDDLKKFRRYLSSKNNAKG